MTVAEIIRELELHRRGESPAQASLRVLKAANALGLDGYRIVRLSSKSYTLGDDTMDVVVVWKQDETELALNDAGTELVRADPPKRPDCALGDRGQAITCMECGKTSYNLNDVKHLYCGNCHRFHGSSITT